MVRFAPIRKVAVGALAGLVVLAARKVLHVHLGSDTAAGLVNIGVSFAASYAVRDRRVRHLVEKIEADPYAAALEDYLLARVAPGVLAPPPRIDLTK